MSLWLTQDLAVDVAIFFKFSFAQDTLAVYFIVEIDELLAKAFQSHVMKEALDMVPPLMMQTSPPMKRCSLLVGPILVGVLIITITVRTGSRYCYCNVCGINGTRYDSVESYNWAVAKGKTWHHAKP